MYVSVPGRPPRGRRHRRRPWLAVCIVTVLVVWGVWTAVTLSAAARDAQRAADVVRRALAADVLADRDAVRTELVDARRLLEDARRGAGSPVTAPLRLLPVVGRHLRAVRTSLDGAVQALVAADEALSALDALAARAPSAGTPVDPAVLDAAADDARRLHRRLAAIRLPDTRHLIGPVRRRLAAFDDAVTRLRATAAATDEAARAGASLLRGPRRCLAVAANNAEMRNGSGMPLAAATVSVDGGRVDVGAVRNFDELAGPGATVAVDPDLQATWGYLSPGAEIRNQALTGRHDASASALAALWSARTGEAPIDCLVTIDAVGLAALLDATGPVTVDGRTFDADGVTDWVLRDQYAVFDDGRRSDRQDAAAGLVATVVGRVLDGAWDPQAMLRALRTATQRRGVMLWSARPDEQRAWRRAGVAGTLGGDDLAVAVVNRGPDKLDPYLRVTARFDPGDDPSDGTATVTVDVTNTATGREPRYVLGPDDDATGVDAARYAGFVVLRTPDGWAGPLDGSTTPLATAGPDGDGAIVAVPVGIEPGATRRVVFRYAVPSDDAFTVVPSARVPAIAWSTPSDAWSDERPRRVRF